MKEDKVENHFPEIEKDLVSIVVPCYNMEKWLGDCLKSIKAQTYKNFEVIFTDDGSTDSTPQILDDFCAQNANAHVIHQKKCLAQCCKKCRYCTGKRRICFFS